MNKKIQIIEKIIDQLPNNKNKKVINYSKLFYDNRNNYIWNPFNRGTIRYLSDLFGTVSAIKSLVKHFIYLLIYRPLLNNNTPHYIRAGYNYIIFPRRKHTYVIVQGKERIWKVYHLRIMSQEALESVDNELYTWNILKTGNINNLAPVLYSTTYSKNNEFLFLELEYIQNTKHIRIKEWPDILVHQLQPKLFELFKHAGIESYSGEVYYSNIVNRAKNYTPFKDRNNIDLINHLTPKMENILNKNKNIRCYNTIVNGDLFPDNIHRNKDDIRIIDWGTSKMGLLHN